MSINHCEKFYINIVYPNFRESFDKYYSLRHAVSAILSMDAFFGAAYFDLKRSGLTSCKDDNDLRNSIAHNNDDFAIFFSLAKALKHGELVYGEPIIRFGSDLRTLQLCFGLFQFGDSWGSSAVYLFAGSKALRIVDIISPARREALKLIVRLRNAPATRPDLTA
jgi:hypothetical protein